MHHLSRHPIDHGGLLGLDEHSSSGALDLKGAFATVVPWSEAVLYIFYGMVLFPLMIVAVVTGFGRREG